MRRLALILLLTACSQPTPEYGIAIFSTDTIATKFEIKVSGTLEMAIRSNGFYVKPDKSLVMDTPGSLLLHQGQGTVTISSFDSLRKIAVEPLGTPPEESDKAAVVGSVVRATRIGDTQTFKIEREKP